MRHIIYFAVGAVVFALASAGRFKSVALFPFVFGVIWAISGILWLLFRRRSLSRSQVMLTIAGCLLGVLSPLGQFTYFRVTKGRWERDALAAFEAKGTPPLTFAHVVNNRNGAWQGNATFGGITVLNFWAPWCSPCLREFPLLEAFSKNHDPSVVRVVGVTRFYEGKDDAGRREELGRIEELLRRNGVSYPSLVALGETTHDRYRVHALPTTVLIGRDGNVVAYGVAESGTKRLLKMAHDLAETAATPVPREEEPLRSDSR